MPSIFCKVLLWTWRMFGNRNLNTFTANVFSEGVLVEEMEMRVEQGRDPEEWKHKRKRSQKMKDKDGCWEIGGGNNLGGLCGPQLYWSWLNEVPEGHRDWMVQSWQCMLPARWMSSLINTQACTSQESATSAYNDLKRHNAFDLMHCNRCKTLQQRHQNQRSHLQGKWGSFYQTHW